MIPATDNEKTLRVTLVYEYKVNPDHYPDPDPLAMATLDIETEPAVILDTEWKIEGAVFS